MNLVPEATPLRFLIAVVAAFTISFSIASMASMVGLLPHPTVNQKAPAFMTPLASHLQAAARIAGQAPAAQPAPAALTPEQAAIEAVEPALIDAASKASRQASIKH